MKNHQIWQKNSWNPINQFQKIFFLAKFHFLQFQKWPKINFLTGKMFKTTKSAISRKKKLFIWFHEFFFAWTFLNFLACCEKGRCLFLYIKVINLLEKNNNTKEIRKSMSPCQKVIIWKNFRDKTNQILKWCIFLEEKKWTYLSSNLAVRKLWLENTK